MSSSHAGTKGRAVVMSADYLIISFLLPSLYKIFNVAPPLSFDWQHFNHLYYPPLSANCGGVGKCTRALSSLVSHGLKTLIYVTCSSYLSFEIA